MQVTETLTEGLKREFKVVVSAEDIEGKVTSKLSDLGKSIRLPGFRPGKVPFSLLKKRYGEALRGEVLEEAVNDSTQQAISESGLKPALQPKIEVTRFEEGTDLEYTMAVEVLPEIVPTDFSTLQLERLRVTVDDEDVERMLQRMADEQKSYVAAAEGHEAGEGNALVIDFAGTIDGEPFEGGSAEDYQLVLGSSTFLPGFEEQLVGVKSGDRRPLEVGFPDDYPAPNLAGKTASFEVTVKEVREAEPVTIDDALAERYGLRRSSGAARGHAQPGQPRIRGYFAPHPQAQTARCARRKPRFRGAAEPNRCRVRGDLEAVRGSQGEGRARPSRRGPRRGRD